MNFPDNSWEEFEIPPPKKFFSAANPKGEPNTIPADDLKSFVMRLYERIRTLEARVKELESRR